MRFHFAIDFDGTVTFDDTTDTLLERLADPTWLDAEKEWLAGRIGSRECLKRQVALLRATPKQIDAVLADIAIDPDFADFIAAADGIGATLEIVSDGFDRCILPLLARTEFRARVTCNRLHPVGADRWEIEFPAASPLCLSGSGVCKCEAARTDRLLVLIGDGRSDFCLASRADFVLAKGSLARHCEERNYSFKTIAGFADVLEWLEPFRAEAMPRSFSSL
jgi:2-hydroxy-3-keto-5-methylthiopentenyl-1-phosphate phosphatase